MPRVGNTRKRYRGRLATPIVADILFELDDPNWEPILKGLAEMSVPLAAQVDKGKKKNARLHVLEELLMRVWDLCTHFGVNREIDGWQHDLLLNLAVCHEWTDRNLTGARFSELFLKYNVNSLEEGAELRLALILARKHVPGFCVSGAASPRADRLRRLFECARP